MNLRKTPIAANSDGSREPDRRKLLAPLHALATAQTTNALREILHQYPDLLTPWADVTLTQLIREAWQRQRLDSVCIFVACRAFLTRCHQIGHEAALAKQQVPPLSASSPLAKLLQLPKDQASIPHRIPLYRRALSQVRRKSEPELWATLQYELANCLAQSQEQDRAQKLEEAIRRYQAVLEVWTPEKVPEKWAQVLHDLGSAFRLRVQGDRGENLRRAIRLYELALKVRTRDAYPEEWAETQICLGIAWKDFPHDDRAKNQKRAFKHYWAARSVWSRRANPVGWARVHHNLGNLCGQSVYGNRAANLERAIKHYWLALKIRTYEDHPVRWAMTQVGLANAYVKRIRGDRAENLERAIELYKETLRVRTREPRPVEWAETQYDLAVAYRHRLYGDRAENQEMAIQCYNQALEVYTRESYPRQWANVHNDLGTAYNQRLRNDRAENIECAIHHYIQSLKVRTYQSFPADWATTRNNLANAYCDRIRGNRELNLERAIRHYNQALKVKTQDTFSYEWAMIHNNLGTACWERVRGDRVENLEEAICHFDTALKVFESDIFPVDARRAARNLGNLYFEEHRWQEAIAPYQRALQAAENLYQASLLRSSKEVELTETADLYRRAAYALARASCLQEAVVTLEQGRARGLSEALARDRIDLERVKDEDPEAYNLYQQAAARLRHLEAAERTDRMASAEERVRLNLETLREQAHQARADLDTAIASIRHIPGYEDFLTQPDFDDVVEAVQLDMPLVYLVVTPAGGLALVAHRENIQEVCLSNLTDKALLGRVQRWFEVYFAYSEAGKAYEQAKRKIDALGISERKKKASLEPLRLAVISAQGAWFAVLEDTTCWLWDVLMESLVAALRELGYDRATLIPTGLLAFLPLHAAWYPGDDGSSRHYALDDVAFAYAPSARALTHAQRMAAQASGETLFAVDNPDGSLRYAAQEVAAVARYFSEPWTAHGERATRNTALAALPQCDVYHFACHGNNNWQNPLESALWMYGQVALTVSDLLGAGGRSQARLAFLSACETGLIGTELPDEVVGLAAGFMQAGTAGVVSTLWSVDDESTALLAERFYENWKEQGMSPLEALVAAQKWLRDKAYGGRWAYPYYWAAFTLTGV